MFKKQSKKAQVKQAIENMDMRQWKFPVRIYDGKGRLKQELKSGKENEERLLKKFGIEVN